VRLLGDRLVEARLSSSLADCVRMVLYGSAAGGSGETRPPLGPPSASPSPRCTSRRARPAARRQSLPGRSYRRDPRRPARRRGGSQGLLAMPASSRRTGGCYVPPAGRLNSPAAAELLRADRLLRDRRRPGSLLDLGQLARWTGDRWRPATYRPRARQMDGWRRWTARASSGPPRSLVLLGRLWPAW